MSAVGEPAVAELRGALTAWRAEAKRGCELAEPLDPARDRLVGDPGATLDVVEYLGYGSAQGARADRMLRAGLRELLRAGRISFAWRHFPLLDAYPHAWPAACAVEAAERQGGFWDLHEALSRALAERWAAAPAIAGIIALAREIGLDVGRLQRDMETPEVAERIRRDFHSGVRSGVNGTPTFYVAGIRQIVDTPHALAARIEQALAGDRAALWPPRREPPARSAAARAAGSHPAPASPLSD
jgi:predicted DsbA family dithiol-disulfide isomerase